MDCRARHVYFAKMAEKAERFDEMVEHMVQVGKISDELSVEERNLLSVAYKHAVGARRGAWRKLADIELQEMNSGNKKAAEWARACSNKIKQELQQLCDAILGLLESNLIPKVTCCDSKVFFLKMKADYYRYIAEISKELAKTDAEEHARVSYAEALSVAEKGLAATHPIRLGLVLNYCAFLRDMLQNPERACTVGRTAFDGALRELDTVTEDTYMETTLILQLLRDNLMLWTSDLKIEH